MNETGGRSAPEHPTCQGSPPSAGLNSSGGVRAPSLGEALAAFNAFLDEVATESQYHLLGKREDPDRLAYLGDIVQRAAARRREQAGT